MTLERYLNKRNVPFNKDISLRKVTKRNNAGLCSFYCKPKSPGEFEELTKFLLESGIRYHLIGDSSNCYFLESSAFIVIVTTKYISSVIYQDDEVIECTSGFNLNKLAKMCIEKNAFGYEGFLGVPGTIGGAVVNNTGAFDSEMSKVVRAITVLDSTGLKSRILADDLGFEIRNSLMKRKAIDVTILSVEFNIAQKVNANELARKVEYVVGFRKKHIDNNKVSLGSVFVSSSYKYLRHKYYLRLLLKSIVYFISKWFIKTGHKALNTKLELMFLGMSKYTENLDTINRFFWLKETKEELFIDYLKDLNEVSDGTLELEVEIKGERALINESLPFLFDKHASKETSYFCQDQLSNAINK